MSIGGMIYRALHRAPAKPRWLEPDIVYRRRLLLKLVDLRIDAMFLTGGGFGRSRSGARIAQEGIRAAGDSAAKSKKAMTDESTHDA